MSPAKPSRFLFANGIGPLIESISSARKFLKLVSFQLSSPRVVRALEDACLRGVKVSVITLPPDSYAGNKADIEVLFQRLRSAGANLSLCVWEVGEPRLTTTSLSGTKEAGMGQKWYSLHAKFLVNELVAQVSSSNCTDENRLECYLHLYDDPSIAEYEERFSYLRDMFVDTKNSAPGSLLFSLPHFLQDKVHERVLSDGRLLVKEYPSSVCPSTRLRPGLFICPFQGKARDFLAEMIETAQEYLFLSSERFFDEELTGLLLARLRNRPLEVRIMSGPPRDVRQDPAKAKSMLDSLLAAGCKYASPPGIHAKLWLSEKWLAIGSPNLTKMNLGFSPHRNYWRADTQVLQLRDDSSLIQEAVHSFDDYFGSSPQGISVLADSASKIQTARKAFRSVGLKCTSQAAVLMSRLECQFAVEATQKVNEVISLSSRLARREELQSVDQIHVAMAAILLLLRERRHPERDILERLSSVISRDLIVDALSALHSRRYIRKTAGAWAVDISTLVGNQ